MRLVYSVQGSSGLDLLLLLFIIIDLGLEFFFLPVELVNIKGRPSCFGWSRSRDDDLPAISSPSRLLWVKISFWLKWRQWLGSRPRPSAPSAQVPGCQVQGVRLFFDWQSGWKSRFLYTFWWIRILSAGSRTECWSVIGQEDGSARSGSYEGCRSVAISGPVASIILASSLCSPIQPRGEMSRVTRLLSMVSKPIVFF